MNADNTSQTRRQYVNEFLKADQVKQYSRKKYLSSDLSLPYHSKERGFMQLAYAQLSWQYAVEIFIDIKKTLDTINHQISWKPFVKH